MTRGERTTQVSPTPYKAEFKAARGEIAVTFRSPAVVLTRITGHFSADMQDSFLRPTNEAIARGARVVVFHDWEAMTGYDTSVRQDLTRWSLTQRAHIASINILVRSKIVAMGVATAGLTLRLGGMHLCSYTARSAFLSALLAAVAKQSQ